MTAAKKLHFISVEDYLAGELVSQIKHEFVDGIAYAMACVRNIHDLIASNVIGVLFGQLRGKKCRSFNSDTQVRIQQRHRIQFDYPDAMVVCRPNDPQESFQDEPTVIVEVFSRRTCRIDLTEKNDAYLSIPSLTVYIVLEQDKASAQVFRRDNNGFEGEAYEGFDAVIPLPSIEAELPLSDVYEGVVFSPEPVDSDEVL